MTTHKVLDHLGVNTKHRSIKNVRFGVAIVTLAVALSTVPAQAAYGYYGGHYSGYYGHHGFSGHRGFSGHHGFSGYPYYYGLNNYSYTPRSTYRPRYRSLEDDKGWSLLARGKSKRAKKVFVSQAASNPGAGQPKVGYALSAALLGDLDRGVWAMRRALSSDTNSLHYVDVNEALRPQLYELVHDYQERSDRSKGDPDAAFMASALYYLLDDNDAARVSISQAVDSGDDSASAANLRRLLDRDPADANLNSARIDRPNDTIGTVTESFEITETGVR